MVEQNQQKMGVALEEEKNCSVYIQYFSFFNISVLAYFHIIFVYFLFQAFSVKCFDFHNETVNLLLVVDLLWTNVCSHVKSTQSFHCYLVMLLSQGNVFDNIFVMSMRQCLSQD